MNMLLLLFPGIKEVVLANPLPGRPRSALGSDGGGGSRAIVGPGGYTCWSGEDGMSGRVRMGGSPRHCERPLCLKEPDRRKRE